jgi:predicted SAM-dependent methyltransferase
MTINSWTGVVRPLIAPLLEGKMGLDLGFGGDAISPHSITMDLPKPYTNVGDNHQHLAGDARNLYWFRDGVLDYVYSSHLLEDFAELEPVLTEWLRVIKPGGQLILCLPYEQKYREYCKANKEGRNLHHTHKDMNPDMIMGILTDMRIPSVSTDVDPYSFLIIAQKM